MKTNNLVPTETHFKIVLDLQVPKFMVSQVTPNDIQTALNRFFQQHPQILSRMLETFGTTSALELPTPLPRVTKSQRETLLSTIYLVPTRPRGNAVWTRLRPVPATLARCPRHSHASAVIVIHKFFSI